MNRYPFAQCNVVHNSLYDTVQYKIRNRALTSTVSASWPMEEYNNPDKRKEIARKLRIFRKLVRS